MSNLWSFILLSCAAALWAAMTVYELHFEGSIFSRLGPFWAADSWKRKYKRYDDDRTFRPAPNTWYYRVLDIKYKERFPLSASLLAWATDGYHLTQMVFIWCVLGAIVTFNDPLLLHKTRLWDSTVAYLILARVVWSGTFTLFFSVVLRQRK